MGFTGARLPSEVLAVKPGFYPVFSEGYKTADNFMSFSFFLIVGGRTLITHAPILGDGYKDLGITMVPVWLRRQQNLSDFFTLTFLL